MANETNTDGAWKRYTRSWSRLTCTRGGHRWLLLWQHAAPARLYAAPEGTDLVDAVTVFDGEPPSRVRSDVLSWADGLIEQYLVTP